MMEIIYDGKGGIYTFCSVCNKLVKINKWILGDLHFCEPGKR